ncbi:hypothetical protein GWO43_27310 [candidate division KSB1 bacterium]|nr:hypothetical protein [candidate division KSB1 bacterium]NIR70492.1 hypothetical protein [candidate division KSB1 bacterium]NIS27667.1 hypothetical protein [candidate division KSB1 bacterium]NIT74502.1 hypothetical protein [candidate division KSB1 bacterium]NIU23741.1 hypothetical protein [candidate division KSB1 bacterium]
MAEQKKSGKGCLIALAIIGAFFVLVVVAGAFFFYKFKDVAEGVLEGVGASPEMVEQVKSLNQEYPFMEPADNRITEDQIQTFINIKRSFADKIKSREEEFKQFAEEAEQQQQLSLDQYAEAWKKLGEIRRDFLDELRAHQMSPKEYKFLTEQIYASYFGNLAAGVADMAEGAGASSQESAELEQKVAELPQENLELIQKYQTELQEVNTYGFELWGLPIADYK